MKDRLFVPLKSLWFDLFKKGEKKWELRGINNNFNVKTVIKGRKVELRKGYNGESLFGVVSERIVVNDVKKIPSSIYNEIISLDIQNAGVIREFIDYYTSRYESFILFKVVLDGNKEERK